jgi:hypothetical protein
VVVVTVARALSWAALIGPAWVKTIMVLLSSVVPAAILPGTIHSDGSGVLPQSKSN